MQDRYAGDIGDFGKLGLLRALRQAGFSIGVNWYYTRPPESEYNKDGTLKQGDGRYRDLHRFSLCDPLLAAKLTEISGRTPVLKDGVSTAEDRSVAALVHADMIPEAVYYVDPVPEEPDRRASWHAAAVSALSTCDIVFLDPDNGLCVPSAGKAKRVKYVQYNELSDYRNKAVIVYNHRRRQKPDVYFADLAAKLPDYAMLPVLTFSNFTVRDYLVLINKENIAEQFLRTLEAFAEAWSQYMKICFHQDIKE